MIRKIKKVKFTFSHPHVFYVKKINKKTFAEKNSLLKITKPAAASVFPSKNSPARSHPVDLKHKNLICQIT